MRAIKKTYYLENCSTEKRLRNFSDFVENILIVPSPLSFLVFKFINCQSTNKSFEKVK